MADVAMRPNPWDPYWLPQAGLAYRPLRNEYPAAGMVPHLFFGSLGKWSGPPQLGLVIALLALTIAVLAPAVWAARGARSGTGCGLRGLWCSCGAGVDRG